MPAASYVPLDDALETLAAYGPALDNGNFNHAPMVAEALCALDRPDAVKPWIEAYRARMLPRPEAGERIAPGDWRTALGDEGRFAAWAALFGEELAEAAWRAVLDRWLGRLAPGFAAAATHGVIRVAHAARALADRETPWRRHELADALASWASAYRELPTIRPIPHGALTPREAIAKVAMVPLERRQPGGNITTSLRVLDEIPEFAPAIGLIDVGGDVARLVPQMTEVFARLYLANARDGLTTIVFIHGVTSAAALGNIAPHVDAATARAAARFAWQAGCALYARFGDRPEPVEAIEADSRDEEVLVNDAISHGDEHVIKFTEACLRQHALNPSPAYLAAARHVIGMVRRR